MALMLSCEVDWVIWIENSPDSDTWGLLACDWGTTSRDTHQTCFSQHVQPPAAYYTRLRHPLLQPFCYRGEVDESVEQILQHSEEFVSRRLINSNNLDALVCEHLLQPATEIRRLAKSTDEQQMLVMSLDWSTLMLEYLNALTSTFLSLINFKQLDSIRGTTSTNTCSASSLVRVIRPFQTPCSRSLSQS